ncbi:thioredoxin domain-containing protein [Rhodococcus sp. BP-252]|uniref:DsbA family protein n=1 Tax=unclassified Rhodococcus (in: high G+C Gram-positive bacteria) TaxID=192944 RepID=UPI001C9A2FEA|nr:MULTISPECIES: thioredoxin domain-containing protein [unclassified Rhodococcus (in: high G+C Gram-positive bacteria)]MBY6412371.1 thioredoxin domain-containing protein [Rhodococcus sp. BP-320]MBY6416951.1 thioredoxin domain-containing protein [Rhodococcus sp. BP-321]MBY6422086.1 thioredoxin domain-containing protein [Rhodococcus sp. BP-324]MBY6426975.1 thioredoxin domain-containing protein [Rhodococcus sp. BP-323]MBY6432304.1 thioredoxin domain-containing protein [Rhodococcus sp. BP-322]
MSQNRPSSVKHTPQPTSSTSTYILAGVALVVVVIVVVVAILWQRGGDEPRNDGYGSVKNADVALTVQDGGVVQLARPGATTTVDLFEDPMCPFCGQLEIKHGQELAQKIDDGAVAVRYHMVVLPGLDAVSASGNYSSRAAAASQCVAASENAVVYSAFHSGLFAADFQPEENADSDRSDSELADLARRSGASDVTAECITSGAMAEQAAADADGAREALAATGAAGTPGVLVDGSLVDALRDSGWVESIG